MIDAKPTRLRKKATREEILASLPVQARVRPARWLLLWLIVVVCIAVFVWAVSYTHLTLPTKRIV